MCVHARPQFPLRKSITSKFVCEVESRNHHKATSPGSPRAGAPKVFRASTAAKLESTCVHNPPNEAERVDDEAIRPAGARVSKHSLRLTERDPVSRQGCAGRGRVSLRGINYFVVVKQGILGNTARGRFCSFAAAGAAGSISLLRVGAQ